MKTLSAKLRESANTLARNSIHEIPGMAGFCERLRRELNDAAAELDQRTANRADVIAELKKTTLAGHDGCPICNFVR